MAWFLVGRSLVGLQRGVDISLMLIYLMYYINPVSLYSVILQFNLLVSIFICEVTLLHYGKSVNKYVTVIPYQELQYYR